MSSSLSDITPEKRYDIEIKWILWPTLCRAKELLQRVKSSNNDEIAW